MAQTLLTEIQDFCERSKLPVPAVVATNPDPQVVQLKAILYETGNALAMRGDWSALTFEATHTTVATEDQGNIYTITATSNLTPFRKIKEETMWDQTDRLPIHPINPTDWQRIQALSNATPRYRYRLMRHHLFFTPTPTAGHTVVFEWLSKWWIQDGTSGAIQERFNADSNSFLVERELLKLGMTWRWRKAKGYDYTEEYEEYEARLAEVLGHDVPRAVLHLDEAERSAKPGIFVPESGWFA